MNNLLEAFALTSPLKVAKILNTDGNFREISLVRKLAYSSQCCIGAFILRRAYQMERCYTIIILRALHSFVCFRRDCPIVLNPPVLATMVNYKSSNIFLGLIFWVQLPMLGELTTKWRIFNLINSCKRKPIIEYNLI